MENKSKKVFLSKETQEELGLSKNYIIVPAKPKADSKSTQAKNAESRQRSKDRKKLQ